MASPFLAAAVAVAALQAPPARPVSIDDAAWLAGHWVGEGLGGQVEETWSPPQAGQMVGHFRLVRAGAPVFYELMLIDVQEGGLRLRVKHFNPDFTGWEERGAWHAFTPRSAAPDDLRFDGLRYERVGETMTATVRIQQERASRPENVVFRFRRTPL